jgi:L,D-peptidoglycan transpeptidase YkuD (ErfK/YbiS/YcfS/YnhG family)
MDLIVTTDESGAWLDWGAGKKRCAIGWGGIGVKTREGDGITPRGAWPIREVFYRPDRVKNLEIALPLWKLAPDDGWCDAPDDILYNQLVKLPYAASVEKMWREDRLYDVVAVIGYNIDPIYPGKGSAIFLHYVKPDFSPTEGCIALKREDLVAALEQLQPGEKIVIR